MCTSLLQFDANLIEGEPYNRLAQLKNKRRLKWRNKIQIYRTYGKPAFKARQNKRRQWGPVQCHGHTVRAPEQHLKIFSTVVTISLTHFTASETEFESGITAPGVLHRRTPMSHHTVSRSAS